MNIRLKRIIKIGLPLIVFFINIVNCSEVNIISDAEENIISDYEKQFTTCPECNGNGYYLRTWTFTGESGNPCVICWKSEKHEHVNEQLKCYRCMGSGKVRIE